MVVPIREKAIYVLLIIISVFLNTRGIFIASIAVKRGIRLILTTSVISLKRGQVIVCMNILNLQKWVMVIVIFWLCIVNSSKVTALRY